MSGLNETTKAFFRTTIGIIRTTLLAEISDAADRRYSFAVKDRSKLKLSMLDTARYDRLVAWLSSPERPHKEREANLAFLVKQRAYTLVNRLVILFQLEARGMRSIKLVSRGVEHSEFGRYAEFFSALTKGEDRGWNFVLQQVWDELSQELPALFVWDEDLECLPIPGLTLIETIDRLADPGLAGAWTDDTTLGWLYQYWNDPDREAVDEKLKTTNGKVEAHELASKTQLFTERYMVEWLVQNSLGAQWLSLCEKRGWKPKALGLISQLEDKRREWGEKEGLFPIDAAEEFWKYYVVQDFASEDIAASPERLEELKILDPAMGSGHFLVYVFDFLFELYREQAIFLGEDFDPEKAVAAILERNVHGIDIDNRAVQIAAAALFLKAREYAPSYRMKRLSIVATDLGLSSLANDDPSIIEFYRSLERETGIKEFVSKGLIEGLKGADYLGSLLDIHKTIRLSAEIFGRDGVIAADIVRALGNFMRRHDSGADLGLGHLAEQLGKGLRLIEILGQKYDVVVANPPYLGLAKADDVLAEKMQAGYSIGKGDLYSVFILRGLELSKNRGRIAMVTPRGWMFISSFEELRNHLFVYHTLGVFGDLELGAFSDMKDVSATMFTIERGYRPNNSIHFNRPVIKTEIRRDQYQPEKNQRGLALQHRLYQFLQSRFTEIPGGPMIYWWPEEFRRFYLESKKLGDVAIVVNGCQTSNNDRFVRSLSEVSLNKVSTANYRECRTYDKKKKWVPYIQGANGNSRWIESLNQVCLWNNNGIEVKQNVSFKYPYLKGNWGFVVKNESQYFIKGIAYNAIGSKGFLCRLHRYISIFSDTGSSIFSNNLELIQVSASSSIIGYISKSINPTIHNLGGDICKLPVLDLVQDYDVFFKRAEQLYNQLFASIESNLEYRYEHLSPDTFEVAEARIRDEIDKEIFAHFQPETLDAIYEEIGASPFDYPAWDGTSIPDSFAEAYQKSDSILALSQQFMLHPDSILALVAQLGLVHESRRQALAWKHLSWSLGVLLGRFDPVSGGLTDLTKNRDPINAALNPHGLIYLSALDDRDSLTEVRKPYLGTNSGKGCIESLHSILERRWGADKAGELWSEIDAALVQADGCSGLGEWLRLKAFDRHVKLYENKPIYFPLISAKKSFFIWINIHQWNTGTLNAILANYLKPELQTLEGRLRRLREDIAKSKAAKEKNSLEDEVFELDKLRDELSAFVALVSRLAEKGPDPAIQEVEVPFEMDLDDGVMVNSAALWELMKPLWRKPAEWWATLSKPTGKKDFDWSHFAMRYWPDRVMAKVKKDPSLAVAHSDYGAYKGRDLFEELHPQAAKKWREQEKKKGALSGDPEGPGLFGETGNE